MQIWNLVFILAGHIVLNVTPSTVRVQVKLEEGLISGLTQTTIQEPHEKYFAFKGIPYAEPPTGALRFQPPQPIGPWNGTKQTTQYGSMCPQKTRSGDIIGSEDCLTLNVFTKNINPHENKAVMVWFHGGAHISGYSGATGPDYLITEDIVLVTVNFRLGIFGFFTTNDQNAYGNNCFRDQILALKWIQRNIGKFGGDPKKVTIFGNSSGSHSVAVLHLSPLAKGLFHRMIQESGASLSPRYWQRDPDRFSKSLAQHFGINGYPTNITVDALQRADYKDLVQASSDPDAMGYRTEIYAAPFYPTIEKYHKNAVIAENPYPLLDQGKFHDVDYLIGINTAEGSNGISIVERRMNFEDFRNRPELFSPQSLNLDAKEDNQMIGRIVRAYFLGKADPVKNKTLLAEFLGEEMTKRGVIKTSDLMRKHKRGYFYEFDFKGSNTTTLPGAGHGEERWYLFHQEGTPDNRTAEEILTSRRMVKMWTNFAKFGNPTVTKDPLLQNVTWEPTTQTDWNYLHIGNDLIKKKNPDSVNYKFWNDLFDKYGKAPRMLF